MWCVTTVRSGNFHARSNLLENFRGVNFSQFVDSYNMDKRLEYCLYSVYYQVSWEPSIVINRILPREVWTRHLHMIAKLTWSVHHWPVYLNITMFDEWGEVTIVIMGCCYDNMKLWQEFYLRWHVLTIGLKPHFSMQKGWKSTRGCHDDTVISWI